MKRTVVKIQSSRIRQHFCKQQKSLVGKSLKLKSRLCLQEEDRCITTRHTLKLLQLYTES